MKIVGTNLFEQTLRTMDHSVLNKVWIWMDFVKPGKNVFQVTTPAGFDPETNKNAYYMHKFVGTVRLEEIPSYRLKLANESQDEESPGGRLE